MFKQEREDMPLKVIIEEIKKLNETLEKANRDVDDMRKKANEDFNRLTEKSQQLKHYQLGDCMNDCEHYENCSNYIYSKGYNKAIDDLVEKIKDEAETKWFFDLADEEGLQILIEKINRIVEQLKSQTEF